jgi:Protein of unknown function (DUF4232)
MKEFRQVCVTVTGGIALCITATGCVSGNPTAFPPSTAPASPSSGATASATSESLRPAPSAPPAPARCRAGDLTLNSIHSDGASGHVGYETIVTNIGARPCRLIGDHVVVVYVDATGQTKTLPTRPASNDTPATPTLQSGQRAEMTLLIINGYGGYDPSSSACAHPAVYRNLSAKFSNGGLLPLKDLVLDVKCGDIVAHDWTAAPG